MAKREVKRPIIVLLTDFGDEDGYVAQVKGVLLSKLPDAQIVDATHNAPKFDAAAAARILQSVIGSFPDGTVFLCVVDPGVGSARKGVAVEALGKIFVGPYNGLFGFLNSARSLKAVAIDERKAARGEVCPVFHGRDVFAPAAAVAAKTGSIDSLGEPLAEPLIEAKTPRPQTTAMGATARAAAVDSFGNVITTFKLADLPHGRRIERALALGTEFPFKTRYSEAESRSPLCLFGSGGELELALNEGSAADKLGLRPGGAPKKSVEIEIIFAAKPDKPE